MRIYTKEEIKGEWSGKTFRVKFYDNFSVDLLFIETNNLHKGSFSIFQNFIVIKYQTENQEVNWVFRIEYINANNLNIIDLNGNIGQSEELKKTYFDVSLIKKFDFDELNCITITDIKQELQISSLQLNIAKDRNGNPTNYYRHWDYENRYAVVLKNALVEKIKENNYLELTIEKTIKKANLGYYTNFEITEYTEEEYTDCDLREVYEEYYDRSNWLSDAAGTDDPETMSDVYWNLD